MIDPYKWIDRYHSDLCDSAIDSAFRVVELIEEGRIEDAKFEAGRCSQAQLMRDEFRYATKHIEFKISEEDE